MLTLTNNRKKEFKFGLNPSSLSQLPTFSPNEKYIKLLVSLDKEKKKDYPDIVQMKRLRDWLIDMELLMTSQEILCNTKLAFPNSQPQAQKSKYKL